MKYYLKDGEVFAFEDDGSQDAFIPKGSRQMTQAEVAAHLSPNSPIPQSISRFQARAALLSAARLVDVEAAVAAADPFVQLAWTEAQEWRRDSPTLLALANGIGLTDAEIDDLFIQASKITA